MAGRGVPHEWKDATNIVAHKTKDRPEWGYYPGIAHVAQAGIGLLKVIVNRLSQYSEREDILPYEKCDVRPQRATIGTIFVVLRSHQLAGRKTTPHMCFADLAKAYNSVDRTL